MLSSRKSFGHAARTIGVPAQRPVGADASVRPLGNGKFAAMYRKTQNCPTRRRGGVLPLPRRMQKQIRTINGDHATRPVPHRCIPNLRRFTAGRGRTPPLRKFVCFCDLPKLCDFRVHRSGSMWASTPTNVVRICIGASVFAGAYRRADRGVRPYTNSENCRKIPPRLGRDF